jgi:hypothetical protein
MFYDKVLDSKYRLNMHKYFFVIYRDVLEKLAEQHPSRFKLWFTIDNSFGNESWKYSTGMYHKSK